MSQNSKQVVLVMTCSWNYASPHTREDRVEPKVKPTAELCAHVRKKCQNVHL
jgi:hypothetical protein